MRVEIFREQVRALGQREAEFRQNREDVEQKRLAEYLAPDAGVGGGVEDSANGPPHVEAQSLNRRIRAGAKEPSVEIQLKSTTGYQAFVFDVQTAFSPNLK